MGGLGSSRWGTYSRKATFEQCLAFPSAGQPPGEGPIGFWADGDVLHTYTYAVTASGAMVRHRAVRFAGGAAMTTEQAIRQVTRRVGAACRPFWCCPCGRLVVRLYLPMGADAFACRHCHGLVYGNNQRRRKAPNILGMARRHIARTRAWLEKWANEQDLDFYRNHRDMPHRGLCGEE